MKITSGKLYSCVQCKGFEGLTYWNFVHFRFRMFFYEIMNIFMITVRLYKFPVKGICNFLLLTIIFCNNVWSREFTNSNIQFQNFSFLIKQFSAKFSRQFQQKTNKDFSGETFIERWNFFFRSTSFKNQTQKSVLGGTFSQKQKLPSLPHCTPLQLSTGEYDRELFSKFHRQT